MTLKASSKALCGGDKANAQALVKALRAAGFTALLRNSASRYGGNDSYTVKTNCVGAQFDAIWDACPMTNEAPQ